MKNLTKLLFLLVLSIFIIGSGCQQQKEPDEYVSNDGNDKHDKDRDDHVVVLTYHNLVKGEPQSGSELNVEGFQEQMEYLHNEGYNTLSLGELIEYHEKGYFPEKSVVITFDDGYMSFYTKAYPIFEKYEFNAAVFPIVSLTPGLERRIVWVDHLTFHHMRLMDDDLICVGSHTYDLHHLTSEDEPAIEKRRDEDKDSYAERIERDLIVSRELLELQTDRDVFALAWPFGVYTDTAKEIALDVNFELLFTIEEETLTVDMPLDEIPRYSIVDESLEEFAEFFN